MDMYDILKKLNSVGSTPLYESAVPRAADVDKSKIPAYKRKDSGEEKLTLKDLEAERSKSATGAAGLKKLKDRTGISESEVEEGNEYVKARKDAIRAGKPTFTVGGKTHKVTGDTSQEKTGVEESAEETPRGRIHRAAPGGYGRKYDQDDEEGGEKKPAAPKIDRGRGRPKKERQPFSGDEAGKLQNWIVGNKPKGGLPGKAGVKHTKMADQEKAEKARERASAKDELDELSPQALGNYRTAALAQANKSGGMAKSLDRSAMGATEKESDRIRNSNVTDPKLKYQGGGDAYAKQSQKRFAGAKQALAKGAVQNEGEEQLTVQQLATISDEALDNAYHYGRSSPGNTFGWQANLKSASYAKQMIDKGITDIEQISDAIHKGWNVTAQAFVKNPDQFDDTAKLQAAGKLEGKLQQRAQLMKQNYAQLPDEEKEKDRVVARALLQALKGQQGVAEGEDEFDPANRGEYDREGEMAQDQLKTAADAANELRSILDSDENLPEWIQSKITMAMEYLDTARDNMKSREDDEEPVKEAGNYSAKRARAGADIGKPGKNFAKIEKSAGGGEKGKKIAGAVLNKLRHPKKEVEETTTAGSVATAPAEGGKKTKGGVQFGKGVYEGALAESFSSKLKTMLNEEISMNLTTNSNGTKSLTVTATDDDAMRLAEILKLAGMESQAPAGDTAEACGDCGQSPCGCDHIEEDDHANSPDPMYADTEIMVNKLAGGPNDQKLQVNPNNMGDNPLAMDRLGRKQSPQVNLGAADIGESIEKRLWTIYNRKDT